MPLDRVVALVPALMSRMAGRHLAYIGGDQRVAIRLPCGARSLHRPQTTQGSGESFCRVLATPVTMPMPTMITQAIVM